MDLSTSADTVLQGLRVNGLRCDGFDKRLDYTSSVRECLLKPLQQVWMPGSQLPSRSLELFKCEAIR